MTSPDIGRPTRMVRLVNGRGVTMIHARSCHMAQRGRAESWHDGVGLTPQQLVLTAARLGVRPCRRCRPFPTPDPKLLPGYLPPSLPPRPIPLLGQVSGA